MFKTIKAIKAIKAVWRVLRNKDLNRVEEPIEIVGPTVEEIAKRRAVVQLAKEQATARGEPFIAMVEMEVDYNEIGRGGFEFEWNDLWIARLMKAGYQGKTDADLVDQWYTNVCRNVVLETFEQDNADPFNRTTDLGDGRREYK